MLLLLFGISVLLAPGIGEAAQRQGAREGPELKYSADNPNINYGRIILTYDSKQRLSSSGASGVRAAGVSARSSRKMKHNPVEIVDLSVSRVASATAESRQNVLDAFRRLPGVVSAEYDSKVRIAGFDSQRPGPVRPASDMTGDQWYLGLIGAQEAWTVTMGDPDMVVAVIDTGVNNTHPDLSGAMWSNTPEAEGTPGVDDDGNGLIDDFYGWNFVNDNNDASDDHSHGSHVAGIIAASDNGDGITGVAAGVKVMSMKVLDAAGEGSSAAIINALDQIYDYKNERGINIRAVNMSLSGSSYTHAEFLSIENLGSIGIPVFAAASNDGLNNDYLDTFPANYALPNVISVGSLTRDNELSYFTNYGKGRVRVYAYGSDILSTVLGTGYGYKSGTSMASPMACGVYPLAAAQRPAFPMYQTLARFFASLSPMTDVGGGRINASAVMGTALDPVSIFKTSDIFAMNNHNFFAYGNGLTAATFTLGGSPVVTGFSSLTIANLSMSWAHWTTGDTWRRLVTSGFGESRSPFLMPIDIEEGTELATTGLPADRHLFMDNLYIKLGSVLYTIVKDDTLFPKYLASYDISNGTYEEFELPVIPGIDSNRMRLFEHNGYIYIPGLVDFTSTVMHRFSLLNETFSTVSYGGRTTEFLSGAMYASNPQGTELFYAGASGVSGDYTYDQIFRFNPETGEREFLTYIPYRMWDMAFAYNNGKLYVVGGERCPAIFFWVNTNVSFVYDIATGRSHSLTLPFDAQRGKLLFSGNKALYILSEQRGSGSRRRVLAGMTDMTTSGWFHNWEVLPKAIHNLWSEDTDTISMAFKGTEANALRILTKNAVHAWDYRTFNHPAGTIRPDPVFPGPDPDPDPDPQPDPHPQPPIPSSGGGGCSAGAFSPWMVLLAVPLLMLKKKQ